MANFLRQIVLDRVSAAAADETKQLILNSVVKECIIGSAKCNVTLYEIVFVNEMYSPAHLTVKFSLVHTDETQPLPSYQEIVNFFLLAKVSIQRASSDSLDTDYYVHEVRPTYVNSGQMVVLYLDIYSADKLMTLDKYSKSYVHKSLFEDIIDAEAQNFTTEGIEIKTKDLSTRLKFKKSQSVDEKSVEIIHPYLVQYNETFYDFLARSANRMGEFLYFADGSLTLGVKADTSATEIVNYASFSVNSRNNSVLKTRGISRQYMGSTHDKSSDELRYTQPTSNDDYLVHYEKDEFDSFAKEYKPGMRYLPYTFKSLFNTGTIGGLIAEILVGQGKDMVISKMNANSTNDKYNQSAIKDAPGRVDDSKAVLSGTYREKGDYIDDWYVNINADFYNKIDECEKKMGSRTVTITLNGNDTTKYQVGQIVKVSSNNYVITHVRYSEISDGRNMRYEYILQALPLLNVALDKSTHEAVLRLRDDIVSSDPASEGFDICCPMALPEERRIRKASPQTAWVCDSDDPKYQGRVRIRYAWDPADTIASPWLRQAEPAAGKGAGISFRLYKDDEVMIGYENDNIEQPFVIGALFHGKDGNQSNGAPVGRNKALQCTHQLSNMSGHKLIVSEYKNNARFWMGLQPGLSYLGNTVMNACDESEDGSSLAGGFIFTDKYGIYNVLMSSDQRLISIASPMGNVKLSAFSGISITAPRGNISISGKNVSIKAANKLTLVSGENAKNTEYDKTWTETGKGTAILDTSLQGTLEGASDFLTSLVDMSLLRHVVECFIAPVDGTLQIKSNRYLLLEAGKGSAMIPQDGFQEANIAEKDLGGYNKFYGGSNKAVKMKLHIEELAGLVDGTAQFILLLNNVKAAAETYKYMREKSDKNGRLYEEVDSAYAKLKNASNKDSAVVQAILLDSDFIDSVLLRRCADIETAGWNLFGAINELKKFVKSFGKKNDHWAWVSYLKDPDFGIAFTKAEDKYRELFSTIIEVPNDIASIDNAISKYNSLIREKFPKSKILFTYLTALRDLGTKSVLQQNPKITDAPTTDEEWESFFEHLEFHTPEGHTAEKLWGEGNDRFINTLKKNINNANLLLTFNENNNWGYDRAKHGRILFSDQDGNTYYVNSKYKSIQSNPNPNIGEIRKLVMNIYRDEESYDYKGLEPLL